MSSKAPSTRSQRPERTSESPVPALPKVDISEPGKASTEYSAHRTKLSTHRTALSEHRTALSEYRSDLSTTRTDLSTERTEMSTRRTGMSFQRTRMSADRTLMSVIRTSLSLITFGFTIHQAFTRLAEANVLTAPRAAANFGIALVALGVTMLLLGTLYHVQFMVGLRTERHQMTASGLIHGESRFPVSLTLIIAVLLLAIGLTAIVSMVFRIGPFG
jgi:uncharacterized membrane protein YidH (DUF202 family)